MKLARLISVYGILAATVAGAQAPLLPDLTVDPAWMSDNVLDFDEEPGKVLLRVTTSTPNIGAGEFYIQTTGEPAGDGLESVVQRIGLAPTAHDLPPNASSSNTSPHSKADFEFQPLPNFRYEPGMQMMVVDGWLTYRLREMTADGTPGDLLRENAKPAVRITSTTIYDGTLPNVPRAAERIVAGNGVQGISVGYTDIYFKTLWFQWIEVTGLRSGLYWIEVEVNPARTISESNYSNNIAWMEIDIELPDADGDGLSDTFEESIGTDPGLADTDGDQHTDAQEVDAGSDPLDPDDPRPPLRPFQCESKIGTTGTRTAALPLVLSLGLLALAARHRRAPSSH